MDSDSNYSRIGINDMDSIQFIIKSSLLIYCVNTLLYPLDTITTILMSETKHPTPIFSLLRKITSNQGFFRLYRGWTASLLGAFPGQATLYYTYEHSHSILPFKSLFLNGFISGGLAELVAGVFYVPSDIISQKLQVGNSHIYSGPSDVFKRIYKHDGLRGFYRGYFAYISAYAPGSAVQWGTYEFLRKHSFKLYALFENRLNLPIIPQKEHFLNGICGGVASFCAISANNPLEVIRVRLQLLDSSCIKQKQILQKGYWGLAKSIYQKEGWKAFYKGLKMRTFVAVPTAVITMTGYESVKSFSEFEK